MKTYYKYPISFPFWVMVLRYLNGTIKSGTLNGSSLDGAVRRVPYSKLRCSWVAPGAIDPFLVLIQVDSDCSDKLFVCG